MDSPELWLIGFFVFILGAAVGSFLNVVIYRVPEGLSLLHPPSRCPQCKTQLRFYDNVPIAGWLWLKGRCRYCGYSIPARYPLIEAATAILFVLTYIVFGPTLQTLGYCLFLSWLLALTVIDLDLMILPNALTQSGVIAGWIFQGAIAFSQTPTWMSVVKGVAGAFIASVLGIWLFDSIRVVGSWAFRQDAMGGGDPKLAAAIGAWLGWPLMLVSAFLACLFGSIIGVGGISLGLIGRRQAIPFGPYLALGGAIAAFYGTQLIELYRGWLGL
ncbi:prepilin peptidase [Altericista sp. CCNU0014]|uniref:prepilin peptidase n=1 Tax=Altericista sp. CCNU0014 TaxID=3082949 RepID=UPI00384F5FB2